MKKSSKHLCRFLLCLISLVLTMIFTGQTSYAEQQGIAPEASLTLKSDKTAVLSGDILTYMITMENKGRELDGATIIITIPTYTIPMENSNEGWTYVSGEDPKGEKYSVDIDNIEEGTPDRPTVLEVDFKVKVLSNLPNLVTNLDAEALLMVEGQQDALLADAVDTAVLNSSYLPNTGGFTEWEIIVMLLGVSIFIMAILLRFCFKKKKNI